MAVLMLQYHLVVVTETLWPVSLKLLLCDLKKKSADLWAAFNEDAMPQVFPCMYRQ
jgi:hypothetical protein